MSKKALIIDDSAEFRDSLKELLTSNDYEVITAESGEQGYTEAVNVKPDLILLDVMMENSGAGLDTVKKLRDADETAGIPVMLLTGIHKPQHLLESFAPGEEFPNVRKVFEKPVSPSAFVEVLGEI
ncbi:MAG: response regulator [Chitinivibrionales bacterium]|nr:response regulator [Chitinivibrionales bacterium]